MTPVKGLDRITVDPNVLGGKPCIRGLRISVALILNLLANGMPPEEILKAYPYLEPEDIHPLPLRPEPERQAKPGESLSSAPPGARGAPLIPRIPAGAAESPPHGSSA